MNISDELGLLSVVYETEKKRDASSKIRGFIFQDYIAIDRILRHDAKTVWSEYLEDVDVLFNNNCIEIIQAKYYPSSALDILPILKDMYCVYLSLQMMHSELNIIPILYYHNDKRVIKPVIDDMKASLGLGKKLPQKPSYPSREDSINWLKANVNNKNKEDGEKVLIEAMASDESITCFIGALKIKRKNGINSYRETLIKEIIKVYPNSSGIYSDNEWGHLLFGLAMINVQSLYCGSQKSIEKVAFDNQMKMAFKQTDAQTISCHLVDSINERYLSIVANNTLTQLAAHMLDLICKNTIIWINKLCSTIEGQYTLYNTISTKEVSVISGFMSLSPDKRQELILKDTYTFDLFLRYMWKIMLDLCQDQVKNEEQLSEKSTLCDPNTYIDPVVTDYVCFNFPQDRSSNHSAILPPGTSDFRGVKRIIIERMLKGSTKPEKWFFQNYSLKPGLNFYDYSTADPIENQTVVNLNDDFFYIECMKCISTEEGTWNTNDNCNSCIFNDKCVHEGE